MPAGLSQFVMASLDVVELPEPVQHVARFLPSVSHFFVVYVCGATRACSARGAFLALRECLFCCVRVWSYQSLFSTWLVSCPP